jgi:hypothetical protein
MSSASLARLVAAARLGFGIGLIAAPGRVTARWLGADAARPGTQVVTRGLGARDVALGAGALAAGEPELVPWVAAAIVSDAVDCIATLAAGRSLPTAGRVLVAGLAAGGSVLGAVALAGLRRSTAGG